MKTPSLLFTLGIMCLIISFSACKKNNAAGGDSTTTTLSKQSSTSDNFTEDANNILTQTVNDTASALGGAEAAPYYNATVTIDRSTFPKTVTIDFGTGTTSTDGIVRSGKIIAVLSNYYRLYGTTIAVTFSNYIVEGYKKSGYITWQNTTKGDTLSWTRVDSGTVTSPDGDYWHHYGTRYVIQTAGFGDVNLFNNIYSITGNHTIINSAGAKAICTITSPLEKKANCYWIDKGQITIQGPIYAAVIDFGNGNCDNDATYTIGGKSYGFKF